MGYSRNTYEKNLNLSSKSEKKRAGSLAWIGHEQLDYSWCKPPKLFIHRTDVDFNGFREYVFKKYVDAYAKMILRYVRTYINYIDNPSMLETFNCSKKNNVLKSLIAYSKYHGFYEEFRKRIKAYGVKWSRSSSIDAFFRIMSNSNNDVLKWYNKVIKILDNNTLSLYLKFALMSGIRKSEAINSFNVMVDLGNKGRINDYYNEEIEILEHFKYPKLFFRNTKNVFISMIPKDLIMEIVKCKPITYHVIGKRLHRRGVRINELRDFYATFIVRHGLIREEVDLLQGRISKSIFVRHYWSPAIKELRHRVFKALQELKQTTLS